MPQPQWLKSITDPFLKLPKKQKIFVLSLAAFAFLALVFVSIYGAKREYTVLFSNLDPQDAGAIVKVLREKGVPFKLESGGSTILVPKKSVYSLRLELAAEGLPKGGGIGFEIFDKTQIGMTRFLEHVNYVRALQGELERTIRELTAVQSVRVHLVIPKKSVFLEEREEPKATVLIKLAPGAEIKPEQVRAITHLVASAVEGLKPENVTVVDTMGRDLTELAGIKGRALAGLSVDRLEYKRRLEKLYEKKILDMLSQTLGPGKAVAKVTVDVDFSKVERLKELYDPESVVRSEENVTERATGKIPGAGGIPGVESNLGPANVIASKTGQVNYEKTKTIKNYEISKTTEKVDIPPGVIKRISASVMVDGIYEKKGKKEEYKPLSQKELDDIKKIVMAAIGYNKRRGDSVEVVNIKFRSPLAKEMEEMKKMEQRAFILALIKYTAFLIFVVLFVLFVLRPLVRYLVEGPKEKEVVPSEGEVTPSGRISYRVGEEEEITAEDVMKDIVGEDIFEELKTEKMKTRVMLERVREWVNKNPGAAAKLLESWIEGEF